MTKPKETCKDGYLHWDCYGNGNAPSEFEHALKNEESYIHEHLMTLHFIAREFGCKNMIEIGTGNGDSTLALSMAAKANNGILTTIDVNDCEDAKERIEKCGLRNYVNFMKIFDHYNFDTKFDLILIDGDHRQMGVREDIQRFLNADLKPNCFVIFHDTNNPRWAKDIHMAMNECHLFGQSLDKPRKQIFNIYEWLNCNGLTVMRYQEFIDHD